MTLREDDQKISLRSELSKHLEAATTAHTGADPICLRLDGDSDRLKLPMAFGDRTSDGDSLGADR